jgi:hypothetical protein
MQGIFLTLFVAGVVFLQKAMVFVLVAMLPSFIAWIIDRQPRKPMFFTVLALNFAGFFPYFMQIVTSQSLAYGTEEMMQNVEAWVVIYGASSAGWLMVLAGPSVCLWLVRFYYRQRAKGMEAEKKELVQEWGIGQNKISLEG